MAKRTKIESMAFGGYGVARVNGKVLFIPYTVTGEEVCIEIAKEKRRFSLGKLVRVIKPSPWRIDPPCPQFGVCGGCQWQHIEPSVHGEMKRKILIESLKHLGKLDPIPHIEVAPAPKPYGYRIRVQLKTEERTIGYYREGSHKIVDISLCPIAHPLVNQIISILRNHQSHFSTMKEIEINVSPQEEKGVLLFHSNSIDQRFEYFAKQFLQGQPILKGIAISRKREWISIGNPSLAFKISTQENENEKERDLLLRISPGSFFQVNFEQNEKLIQTVIEFSGAKKTERILDLYAGAGNLTLPLAIQAGEVWGIEENRTAIEDGRFNAEGNGIRNVHFIEGKVEKVLKDWKKGKPNQIILDPPREGCKKIIHHIVELAPEKIVYVSCEPTTFTRDLHLFTEKRYSLERLRLIDMFPQTYHMELVGLLIRSSDQWR